MFKVILAGSIWEDAESWQEDELLTRFINRFMDAVQIEPPGAASSVIPLKLLTESSICVGSFALPQHCKGSLNGSYSGFVSVGPGYHSPAAEQSQSYVLYFLNSRADACYRGRLKLKELCDQGQILPVIRERDLADCGAYLPDELKELNAFRLNERNTEALACFVLSKLGVLRLDGTIFISYKRAETAALAGELFSSLQSLGVHPFVDLNSLPPAVPMWQRIEQELNGAAAMVVLNSPNYRDTKNDTLSTAPSGTQRELNIANKLRLPLLVVNFKDSPDVSPWEEPGSDSSEYFVGRMTLPYFIRQVQRAGGIKTVKAAQDIAQKLLLQLTAFYAAKLKFIRTQLLTRHPQARPVNGNARIYHDKRQYYYLNTLPPDAHSLYRCYLELSTACADDLSAAVKSPKARLQVAYNGLFLEQDYLTELEWFSRQLPVRAYNVAAPLKKQSRKTVGGQRPREKSAFKG